MPRTESVLSHIPIALEQVKYQSLVRDNEERRLNEKKVAI